MLRRSTEVDRSRFHPAVYDYAGSATNANIPTAYLVMAHRCPERVRRNVRNPPVRRDEAQGRDLPTGDPEAYAAAFGDARVKLTITGVGDFKAELCRWGLISVTRGRFASCVKALTGRAIALPWASSIFRPGRSEILRFQHLFRQACHLAESKCRLIERPEVASALEQEMLHAIINCISATDAEVHHIRRRHAVRMARLKKR